MNRPRLERLIVVLEQVKAEQRFFNMGVWAAHDVCGTACCAAGWAALDPELNADGLSLAGSYGGRYRAPINRIGEVALYDDVIPAFDGREGIDCLADFFGLSWEDAESVFLVNGYGLPVRHIGPSNVIARVKEIMNAYD